MEDRDATVLQKDYLMRWTPWYRRDRVCHAERQLGARFVRVPSQGTYKPRLYTLPWSNTNKLTAWVILLP